MPPATELRVRVGETTGGVSALLVRPADARLLYVLAHGAGAGMRHPFLATISQRLAEREIATLRDLLRSEEHTSELQSRLHLVCRLLLEKKKKKTQKQ